MKSNRLIVSFLIILALCLPAFAADQAGEFYPARVRDISDRVYEGAVTELLDNAKESIAISMHILKIADKGPMLFLAKNLEEALDRGVGVDIYLNTRPGHGMPASDEIDRTFRPLTEKGAKIHKVTPYYLLHDKLIIVDGRFVVDGSTNWSVAALKSNYESADLIDSPELAKVKLLRLQRLLPEDYKKERRQRSRDRPKALERLPEGALVGVSKELLNNKDYFAAMLRAQADRDMNAYLLLLAESARTGEREFFVPLEDLAITLGVSPGWSDTDMRRQMIKELKTLQDKYDLIDVNFNYGKDAWVELKDLPDGAFKVTGDFFDPKSLASKSQPAKFVFLMKALLGEEGKTIEAAGVSELSKKFGVSQFSIRKGMRETGGIETPAKNISK